MTLFVPRLQEARAGSLFTVAHALQARTEERGAGIAPSGKPWGWMSSERVVAGRLTYSELSPLATNRIALAHQRPR